MTKKDKELKLFDVFCMASGAMISSGLFVLPAYIYNLAGPIIILGYFLAGILILPAVFTQSELASAMPQSGGTYFFTVRSLGPIWGTFAGFANWFSIALKGAFALVGMGAFMQLFYPDITAFQLKIVIGFLIVLFTLINLIGTHTSAKWGNIMFLVLLVSLILFVIRGSFFMEPSHFVSFFSVDLNTFITITAMIFISYGGLTKIASVSGEIQNPEKNIPWGMILSFIVVNILYILVITVLVGGLFPGNLEKSLTPLSEAGALFSGIWGQSIMSIAAILAFATTANASIMAASRAPLAMGQDKLLPKIFTLKTRKKKIPWFSIVFTGIFMLVIVLTLDLVNLVKVASAMMLLLFICTCLSVLLNHESRLTSYRPTFLTPAYPYVPIFGIIVYTILLFSMGKTPLYLTLAFFLISTAFYFLYGRQHKSQTSSALIRLVDRITNSSLQNNDLDLELTKIVLERDNVILDRFDQLIEHADILYILNSQEKEDLFKELTNLISKRTGYDHDNILSLLYEREDQSSTVISPELAVPHIVLNNDSPFNITVIYNKEGVYFNPQSPNVKLIFCLAGNKDERNFHLQSLMAIAQIVQNKDFIKHLAHIRNANELRNLILLVERNRL